MAFVGPGCHHPTGPPPEPPPKDPRTYTWTIDTLADPNSPQTFMVDAWASGPNDIYVVGHNAGIGHNMFHYDGTRWSPVGLQVGQGGYIENIGDLTSVFGFSSNNIFAVGGRSYYDSSPPYGYSDSSLVICFDGGSWREVKTPSGRLLQAVWGTRPTDVWAGGIYGTMVHYDGSSWVALNLPTSNHIACIWGFTSNDVYATAYSLPSSLLDPRVDNLWHWDGVSWSLKDSFPETGDAKFGIYSLFAIGGDLYSGGAGVFKKTESGWSRVLYTGGAAFGCIGGNAVNNLFAGEGGGMLYHFNGTDWYSYSQFAGWDIYFGGIWTDGKEVFVVGHDNYRSYVLHGK